VLYDTACEYALADRLDASIDLLKKAYAAGFKDRDAVNRDPDLAKLRNDPRIKELVWCLANGYALFSGMEVRLRAGATQAMRCHR
jgi:hypothetical protein